MGTQGSCIFPFGSAPGSTAGRAHSNTEVQSNHNIGTRRTALASRAIRAGRRSAWPIRTRLSAREYFVSTTATGTTRRPPRRRRCLSTAARRRYRRLWDNGHALHPVPDLLCVGPCECYRRRTSRPALDPFVDGRLRHLNACMPFMNARLRVHARLRVYARTRWHAQYTHTVIPLPTPTPSPTPSPT
jgi:hypothetical protein